MASDVAAAKARAEARFSKEQERRVQGAQALSEHEATARATQEKTARLKALRLAKEAADLEAAPPVVPAKPKAKRVGVRSVKR